jgi:hypothetical protein
MGILSGSVVAAVAGIALVPGLVAETLRTGFVKIRPTRKRSETH